MFNSGISCVEAMKDVMKKLKKKKIIIIVDGGVRKGSDIIKYMCLGADFVGVGRPAIHGLINNVSTKECLEKGTNELLTGMINGGFKNLKSFKKLRLMF